MDTFPTQTQPPTRAEMHAQDALYFRGLLIEMVDLTTEMAQLVVQQAKLAAAAPETAATIPAFAAALGHVTRAARRNMLLAQKFTAPEPKAPVAEDPALRRAAARRQIIRGVEDSIHQEARAAEAGDLHAELMERIDAPEFDHDLDHRPVRDIINELRADLGLHGAESLNWFKRRTPQDIAILCERAAAPCREPVGPYVLPMPPRGWVDTGPPIEVVGCPETPPIRGP